ncbi:hypothetical protein POKO110462_16930 [Pontibacter korlensis]|uniref:Uncharacterized protein n=1 Tax=Pontibacter korlensis TaxID=400092 RepID=A0A0E3ZGB0_9BACT|nr:hypothetical protein [Pontibacter korlensis]AKD03330.1 hypothetical protein PKOR_09620 [Pontibacter korlensis]
MPHARNLLTLLFSLILVPLWAQEPTQPVRLELPFEPEDVEVEVIAFPDSSLLVYHKTSNPWETDATFHFTKYDSQLEEVWTDTANIAPDSDYIRYYTAEPFTYLVFGSDNLRDYTFIRVHNKTGNIWHKKFNLDPLEDIYEYKVLHGNYFIIGRNRKDGKSVLMHLNPLSGEANLLPSVYGEQSSFSDLLADAGQNRVDAVITESNGRVSRLQVKSFDANGKLLNNYFIIQKEDRNLLNAEITPGDTTEKMLIGTYGTRDLRFAQGFYATPLASRVVEGNFYSLLQLRNFLKYMKPRREERTRRREEKRLKSGRGPGFHYRLLLHDLIVTPHGYILAAEAYYPQYSNPRNSSLALDFDNRPYRLPDGIKRTHAVALGFDKNGILLWDNMFPLPGITTFELTHVVEVQRLSGGRVVMAYPDNNKIIYHIMDDYRYNDEKTELELLTYDEEEKVQYTSQAGIIRWYGNSMAAFGFQRIKAKGANFRSVFYVNKITF